MPQHNAMQNENSSLASHS